mgnify:CR=1 FL=1
MSELVRHGLCTQSHRARDQWLVIREAFEAPWLLHR